MFGRLSVRGKFLACGFCVPENVRRSNESGKGLAGEIQIFSAAGALFRGMPVASLITLKRARRRCTPARQTRIFHGFGREQK